MLPPEKLTFEGERDNAEYTLVHNWMKMWLRWLHWYCSVALSPDPPIQDLFSPPICSTTWKRSNKDIDIFDVWSSLEVLRFGGGRLVE